MKKIIRQRKSSTSSRAIYSRLTTFFDLLEFDHHSVSPINYVETKSCFVLKFDLPPVVLDTEKSLDPKLPCLAVFITLSIFRFTKTVSLLKFFWTCNEFLQAWTSQTTVAFEFDFTYNFTYKIQTWFHFKNILNSSLSLSGYIRK